MSFLRISSNGATAFCIAMASAFRRIKAAKALGHEVPAGLVLRADEVIE